jgi:mediator of RNA polymerase II transcription subunit 18
MPPHELLLFGQVPFERRENGQIPGILTGVAAMQPRRFLRRVILYKPLREPEVPGLKHKRGGTQAINVKQDKPTAAAAPLYYQKLIQELSQDDFGKDNARRPLCAAVAAGEKPKFSQRWTDSPDTGDRDVSIRDTHTVELLLGDPHAYMIASGPHQWDTWAATSESADTFRYVKEYYVEGECWVHGNVVITLYRMLLDPTCPRPGEAPKTNLPAFLDLKLFNESGDYELEAMVRVQDFHDAAVLESGVKELLAFKKQMMGCVELYLPNRLALDTRVKYKPPNVPAPATRPRWASITLKQKVWPGISFKSQQSRIGSILAKANIKRNSIVNDIPS